MRQVLEFRYNDTNDTIEVLYSGCKELDTYIQGTVESKSRVWSKDSHCWVVTPEVIGNITAIGSVHFDDVRYFSLPPALQETVKKYISNKKFTIKPTDISTESNYKKLFLIENAPMFLVRAVYKSLVYRYHPDNTTTGDREKFMGVVSAYKELKK